MITCCHRYLEDLVSNHWRHVEQLFTRIQTTNPGHNAADRPVPPWPRRGLSGTVLSTACPCPPWTEQDADDLAPWVHSPGRNPVPPSWIHGQVHIFWNLTKNFGNSTLSCLELRFPLWQRHLSGSPTSGLCSQAPQASDPAWAPTWERRAQRPETLMGLTLKGCFHWLM